MSEAANTFTNSDSDRMQGLAGTAVVVGVIPWVLAAVLHAGPLVLREGSLGLQVALREVLDPPIAVLPALAVLLFVAATRAVPSVVTDTVAHAVIVASVVFAGVLGVLLLAGHATFGGNGLWVYATWGVATAYLGMVAVAAGVRAS